MSTHTKGPWTITNRLHSYAIDGAGELDLICIVHADDLNRQAEDLANANLIAAAPEMLETLQWMLEYVNRGTLGHVDLENGPGLVVDEHLLRLKLTSALKKAKGE